MKHAFRSFLVLAAASLTIATAQAQVATYSYTGTLNSGQDTYFGSTVTGTITLDLGAAPSTPYDGTNGQSEWRNVPNIKITATAANFNSGTGSNTLVNDTVLQQSDPEGSLGIPGAGNLNYLGFNQLDGSDVQQIDFSYQALFGGVVANVNKLQDLSKVSGTSIQLLDANHAATYSFTITASSVVASDIMVGSTDTGIKDVSYQGASVNTTIASYAASAKNHGDFVESVEELVEKLVKAKLLTKAQAQTLNNAAAQSSIGQKPKKNDKDGKEDKDDD